MPHITDKDFDEKVLPEIPAEFRERAKKIFTDYGEQLSVEVVNALFIGLDHNNLPNALKELEEFYEKHVKNDDETARMIKSMAFMYGEYFIMMFHRIAGTEPIIKVGL
jgi:hypothetical protein